MEAPRTHHCYNSAVLVDPTGQVVTHRRKTVLIDSEIRAGLEAGPNAAEDACSPPLPWLGGARVGVLICADIELPDAADACPHGPMEGEAQTNEAALQGPRAKPLAPVDGRGHGGTGPRP